MVGPCHSLYAPGCRETAHVRPKKTDSCQHPLVPSTAASLFSQVHFRATKGANGEGKNCTGREGQDVYIKVPLGTIITNPETKQVLAEVLTPDQPRLVLRGARRLFRRPLRPSESGGGGRCLYVRRRGSLAAGGAREIHLEIHG